jgi:glutamyl-tRNA synthetase
VTLDDSIAFAAFFFQESVQPSREDLIAKGLDARQSAEIARRAFEILRALPDLSHQTAEPPMRAYVERSGFSASQVFGILRVAVTGQKVSPPLFESIEIIGKDKVLERLEQAMALLEIPPAG